MRETWSIIEPARPYVHGWHLDAIYDHLEAVSRGEILRLAINVPFGAMKSLAACVFWPCWEWTTNPWLRIIGTSYRGDYADRDARRMHDLVTSEFYQRHWGDKVQLERSGETSFSNSAKGFRESIPYTSLTGGRGDRVILDDPHSTETAESELERERAIRIFRESVPSRINDPKTSAIVIIMQRLHERDVCGVAQAMDLGYTFLMLPMEFESARKCITYVKGKQFFEDPRTYEGELLFPERFPRDEVDRLKKALGAYAVASQMQQRPAPREGKMFHRAWFGFAKSAPADCRWVRHWDIADTEAQLGENPDYTAGLKLGHAASTGRYYIADVRRVREESPVVRRLIKNTAAADGLDCAISFAQDPGSAGKTVARDLIRMLPGFSASAAPETGSKIARAEPVQSQAEAGNVLIVIGSGETQPEWVESFLAEIEKFPSGAHDDQVDALSGAFGNLVGDAVFNASEANFVIDGRNLPGHWRRAFAFDLDRDRFAAIWAAWDSQADVVYLYDEYRVTRADLAVHKEAMVKRGSWVPGLFDMRGRGRSKDESIRICDRLMDQLNLCTVDLDDEASIAEMSARLSTNRLKVFGHLNGWLGEYRQWQRDDKGEAEMTNDHLVRATALLLTHIAEIATSENVAAIEAEADQYREQPRGNSTTGY